MHVQFLAQDLQHRATLNVHTGFDLQRCRRPWACLEAKGKAC